MNVVHRILDALDWKKMSSSHQKDTPRFLRRKLMDHPDYQRLYGCTFEPMGLLPERFPSLLGAFQYEASKAYVWDALAEDFRPPFDRPKPVSKSQQYEQFRDGTILTNGWPDRTLVFMDDEDLEEYLDADKKRTFPQF